MAEAETFVRIPHWLLKLDLPGVTPAAKLVWGYIQDVQGQNTHAWPGVRKIAEACAINKSTVPGLIKALEDHELLEVVRPDGNSGGKSNHYRTRIPRSGKRTGKADGRKTRTSAKSEPGRTENPSPDVRKTRTDPDPWIQTHRSRSVRKNRTYGKPGQSDQAPKLALVAEKASRKRKPAKRADSTHQLFLDALGRAPTLLASVKGGK